MQLCWIFTDCSFLLYIKYKVWQISVYWKLCNILYLVLKYLICSTHGCNDPDNLLTPVNPPVIRHVPCWHQRLPYTAPRNCATRHSAPRLVCILRTLFDFVNNGFDDFLDENMSTTDACIHPKLCTFGISLWFSKFTCIIHVYNKLGLYLTFVFTFYFYLLLFGRSLLLSFCYTTRGIVFDPTVDGHEVYEKSRGIYKAEFTITNEWYVKQINVSFMFIKKY